MKRIINVQAIRPISSAATTVTRAQVDPRAIAARQAEAQLRQVLQASARTHIGRLSRAA